MAGEKCGNNVLVRAIARVALKVTQCEDSRSLLQAPAASLRTRPVFRAGSKCKIGRQVTPRRLPSAIKVATWIFGCRASCGYSCSHLQTLLPFNHYPRWPSTLQGIKLCCLILFYIINILSKVSEGVNIQIRIFAPAGELRFLGKSLGEPSITRLRRQLVSTISVLSSQDTIHTCFHVRSLVMWFRLIPS